MFSKNMIISGFVSSAMFAAAAFATPASAGQALFRLGAGINGLLNELIETNERAPNVHNIDYRGVPIRKIHRKMLRRGLYPVSEYRLRGDVVILRAEDDSGTLFRVVADAGYGDIIRIRRVDEVSRRRRPVPVDPPYYDDDYRQGYDRPARRNKRRYDSNHAEQKARKDAELRAHAKRKAADRTHGERKARKDAELRAHAKRKAADRAHAQRKAAQLRADRNRRAARVATRPLKKRKRPYIDNRALDLERLIYGSGK